MLRQFELHACYGETMYIGVRTVTTGQQVDKYVPIRVQSLLSCRNDSCKPQIPSSSKLKMNDGYMDCMVFKELF